MGRTRSIADHQLPSYKRSFTAIAKSQFVKGRGLQDGDIGIMKVFDSGNLGELLEMSKGELATIDRLGSNIWAKEREAKQKKRQETLARLVLPIRCLADRWCRCGRGHEGDIESQPVGCMGTNCGCCWGKSRQQGLESAEWIASGALTVSNRPKSFGRGKKKQLRRS